MDKLIEDFNKVIPKDKEEYNKMEKIKSLINELEYEIKNYFISNNNKKMNLLEVKEEIDKEKKMFNKLLFLYYFFEI